ncbi:Gfo/Idh/MocA family protein [Streptomyces sp. NPDC127105]|uniref:Gfo/Idh/MocA family protein n=1 Tax=Streptomyces sp. NPDC127105 TaxID=3345359 RepID=UPI00364A6631
MTAPLRVVLIGAGTRARKTYVPWLAGHPPYQSEPVKPVAVVDTDPDAARTAARALPGAAAAGLQDLHPILAARPDLVIVATPDAAHHDYAAHALSAGCTTLVEKPLATTAADAFDLVHAAERSPARLLVGHNLRFTNLHQEVRALLSGRRIGTLLHADFHYTLNPSHSRSYLTRWHRTRQMSGGLEVTKASHHLDLLAWWLDARPVTITGRLHRRHYRPGEDGIPHDADIHDSVHALIQYSSGATARYALTTNASHDGYLCVLRGAAGTCMVRYNAQTGPHTVQLTTPTQRQAWEVTREDGTHAGADRRMLLALPGTLAHPARAPHFATATEAALAVATGTTLHESSRQGRRLPVPQLPGEET